MPNSALPTKIRYITSTVTMPDGTALDYSKFTLSEPTALPETVRGKGYGLTLSPTLASGYYGDITVLYNKINWSLSSVELVDTQASDWVEDKAGLLALVSSALGVQIDLTELNDEELVFAPDAFGNTFTQLPASTASYLFEGAYQIVFTPWRPVANRLHTLLHTTLAAPNYF